MTDRFYVTTAIPYVNGAPHVGHALELVQADALARHARRRGRRVRFLTGTDDNAIKNVETARRAGVDVAAFVDANAQRFAALREPLDLSNDDFVRTSRDPRHRPAVEWLWQECAKAGDLYRGSYTGSYCNGCEQFVEGDWCAEHAAPTERIEEHNWFFRLSRHAGAIAAAIRDGQLRIEPAARANEVLAFLDGSVRDISVSRPAARAHGWGIPVPGDPSQVVYVWFDALANYISALGAPGGTDYDDWWFGDGTRVHVVGKGIVRFHAVSWPAILRSAGQPWPTALFVHDYLTVDGRKIGKSLGNALDPAELVGAHGTDALRWWLLREVPLGVDADITVDRLVATAQRDLANGIGNFVQRVRGLPPVTSETGAESLRAAVATAPRAIDAALGRFDFRTACEALLAIVAEGNRFVEETRPWEKAGDDPALEGRRGPLADAVEVLTGELEPFVPGLAARIRGGARPVYPRPSARLPA